MPCGKQWQPTAGFMTHVICRLTAKNWDQLRNPTLGNRVWAVFLSYRIVCPGVRCPTDRTDTTDRITVLANAASL